MTQLLVTLVVVAGASGAARAEAGALVGLVGEGGSSPRSAVHLAIVLALVGLAPAIVFTGTCFTRFIIVFSFLRAGLGTAGAPPSQVLVGLALFMTLFVMAPIGTEVHQNALSPYLAGEINEEVAFERATPTVRKFMLGRTQETDLALFYDVAALEAPETESDVPLKIAVPAFAVSELRTGFRMGFLVLLPFLVIDLAVATILSSLGMVMLPPSAVALPIKVLVFVAADGWNLVVGSLLKGAV